MTPGVNSCSDGRSRQPPGQGQSEQHIGQLGSGVGAVAAEATAIVPLADGQRAALMGYRTDRDDATGRSGVRNGNRCRVRRNGASD